MIKKFEEEGFEILGEQVIHPIFLAWPPETSQFAKNCRFNSEEDRISKRTIEVIVKSSAVEQFMQHAKSYPNLEIGGMLIGQYHYDNEKKFVIIHKTIPANKGNSFQGAFVFTLESIIEINSIREENYPNLLTIGWYHSHPGFGVFFSGIDIHSHKTQFNLPFHIGIVIDPQSESVGCFSWYDNSVVGPYGYWICDI